MYWAKRITLEKKKFIATPARSRVVDESSGRRRVNAQTTPTATIAPAKAATEAAAEAADLAVQLAAAQTGSAGAAEETARLRQQALPFLLDGFFEASPLLATLQDTELALALYLVGVSLDFVDTLMESGFKIENPNASNTCGCGQSFS